jgi:hypothetical protein
MVRSVQEELYQTRCVKFICAVGIAFFIVCLYPLVTGSEIDDIDHTNDIPHRSSRVAVISASLPLLVSYLYDWALPKRLTYPRALLLIAVIVPNLAVLLSSGAGNIPMRMSICFKSGSDQLFSAGLLAYIAGEATSKRLLILLAFLAVLGGVFNFYFVLLKCEAIPRVSTSTLASIVFVITIFFFMWTLIWFINDAKLLASRRKKFSSIYIVTTFFYCASQLILYGVLSTLGMKDLLQDGTLLIQALCMTGVSITTSQMAQYDAITAMVNTSKQLTHRLISRHNLTLSLYHLTF